MSDADKYDKRDFEDTKKDFAELMKRDSGLITAKGEKLSLGEVLYVYNLIATGSSMGSSKTCYN
jgi:hypothetical protein